MSVERRKILVLTDWFVPGFRAGGPIRSLVNLLDALPEIDFYVVTADRDHRSTTPYPDISPDSWITYNSHVEVFYAREGKLGASEWKSIFTLHTYNYFYFNSLFSPRFTLQPLRVLRSMGLTNKAVLAPRGMLQRGALGVKPIRKKLFLRSSKIFGFYRGLRWHATSTDEMNAIQNFMPAAQVFLAPNLTGPKRPEHGHPQKSPGQLRMVTISRYSPEKGIAESLDYLKILDGKGIVRLDIYGTRQNDEYYSQCQSLAKSLKSVEVHFHDEVPPDTIPTLLSEAHFFYSATRGENFGHAIAEAFLNGVPVVISDLTPWRNLATEKAGFDCASDAFAPALVRCLQMDNDEYLQWTEGARALGEEIHRSSRNTGAYQRLFA